MPPGDVRLRIRCVVFGDSGRVEVPSFVVCGTGTIAWGRPVEAVRVIDTPIQSHQGFGVIELCSGLFELSVVNLKGGIEGRIKFNGLEEVRIELGLVVESVVTLFECLGAQRLVW